MDEKYCASLVLSGVGDAIGYRNGRWEFQTNPKKIWEEYQEMGGIDYIKVDSKEWRVSDDTVMQLATSIAITRDNGDDFEKTCQEITTAYIRCLEDMGGRAPGRQTLESLAHFTPGMKKQLLKWDELPYAPAGGGCGAAMRSSCIGLKYWSPDAIGDLIRYSIESGRITHNHPVGFLGAMVAALFTSYAIQQVPPRQWGTKLMNEALPLAKQYIEETRKEPNRTWENYEKGWNYFVNAWTSYLELRKIPFGEQTTTESNYPEFPEEYNYMDRDKFYHSLSFDGWGGSSGHDSVLISYDALLGAGSSWKEMIERSAIHGGDNDSTGAIGCAWWGALYGFTGVPDINYQHLEYRRELYALAKALLAQRK
ncbi:hypothetical protein SAMD00019534_014270 [Acytostelium subglobosum LB1]|uniref:hypothetical protein n=1 Tax=Acytostelium subglobosum LB1 TaxID=1410327 RepID=UPI00064490C7|nr:hypothetical protein SAMD00019534_014270 [Acytostelium subglobosum LB1]GAM18252.1 hypothetical protein SAMD00019534_014270 [Acytostelium subglobosum LB1]|eukprot:XP_012758848.1 hypothetical protein SAMD00019534_014270 [Acytostelium subglobosum LB1]